MIAWLTDTLFMTGAIMALILLVRRPVGRWFGPSAAYALWALPMIRLVLPPLVLPEALAVTRATQALSPPLEPVAQAIPIEYALQVAAAPVGAAPAAAAFPWTMVAVVVWLGGAALFLAHRTVAYRVMRRELLRDTRLVGHSGDIRIVESSAVDAPVAFGVFDRVVALPRGFLANVDSDVSDFAIAHELQHHAGNDLLANIAVQPLFALHWFHPLAWLAWRALRSDQEAACDARVMAGCTRREREQYGRVIASFAAGPKFALAAPMAGPLKGDKPIIHRLKALVRNEVPERHRALGRSLFAVSVAAVPLTASVTYAAQESTETAAAPSAYTASAPSTLPTEAASPEVRALSELQDGISSALPTKQSLDASSQPTLRDRDTMTHHTTTPVIADQTPVVHPHIEHTVQEALAEAENARAHALVMQQNSEHMARNAERIAREVQARAPVVEQSFSADGKIQTLRIVTPAAHGKAAMVRTMVIDGNCPADRQPRPRISPDGSAMETRVCSGVPRATSQVTAALRHARASVVANRHLHAEVRAEILADLDEEIAEARAEAE